MANVIVPRVLPAPTSVWDAVRRYVRKAHVPGRALDPAVARMQATASADDFISPIARAPGVLVHGQVGINPARRTWRFRAKEAQTRRVVLECYVEGETIEAARDEGKRRLLREWKRTGIVGNPAIIATVLAI